MNFRKCPCRRIKKLSQSGRARSSEGNLRGLAKALASLYRTVTAIGPTIVPGIEGELVRAGGGVSISRE